MYSYIHILLIHTCAQTNVYVRIHTQLYIKLLIDNYAGLNCCEINKHSQFSLCVKSLYLLHGEDTRFFTWIDLANKHGFLRIIS